MMFLASIINVCGALSALSPRVMTKTQRTGIPHLDRFIGYLTRVRSNYSRVHEPPELLPPVVVFIEIGIIVYPGGGLRGR